MIRVVLSLLGICLLPAVAIAATAPRIAVFPFEINDTSGEPEDQRAEQRERLKMVTGVVQSMLAERGARIITPSGLDEKLPAMPALWECNGCEAPLAAEAEADISVTGLVSKVSTLIQSILIVARDANSGEVIGSASVSIRGDTEEAWRRGVRYIIKKDLLGERVHAGMRHIE